MFRALRNCQKMDGYPIHYGTHFNLWQKVNSAGAAQSFLLWSHLAYGGRLAEVFLSVLAAYYDIRFGVWRKWDVRII